jgi:hypothetical protein
MVMSQVTIGELAVVRNGSFEKDGPIADIAAQVPTDWNDVNMPGGKFWGWVGDDWSSDGYDNQEWHSVGFSSDAWGEYTVGDVCYIEKNVVLGDSNGVVESLLFDLSLWTTRSNVAWDYSTFAANVKIDGVTLWSSADITEPAEDGQYFDQEVYLSDFPQITIDANEHTLSLEVESLVSVSYPYNYYVANFDNVRFDTYCEGTGCDPNLDVLLVFDENNDEIVNWEDYSILSDEGDFDLGDFVNEWLGINWMYGLE